VSTSAGSSLGRFELYALSIECQRMQPLDPRPHVAVGVMEPSLSIEALNLRPVYQTSGRASVIPADKCKAPATISGAFSFLEHPQKNRGLPARSPTAVPPCGPILELRARLLTATPLHLAYLLTLLADTFRVGQRAARSFPERWPAVSP
jgi:hypothetical protein